MTAQIGDKFEFDGENYSIVAKSTSLDFNPVKYGIIPSWSCTACWKGYWCIYNITKEGIFFLRICTFIHTMTVIPKSRVLPCFPKEEMTSTTWDIACTRA